MNPSTFQQAVQRHNEGQLVLAEQLYRQVLEVEPAHAAATFLLGGVHLATGRDRAGIELLQRAVSLNDTEAAFHIGLAEGYRRVGQTQDAMDSFVRALSRQPESADAAFNFGVLFQDIGELELARAFYERAVEAKPDNTAAARRLQETSTGYLLEGSKRSFHRDSAADAVCARGWLALSAVYASLKRYQDAVLHCRRALGYAPRHVSALAHLSNTLAKLNSTDEASQRLRQILEFQPDHLETMTRLAMLLTEFGGAEEGVALIRRSIELEDTAARRSVLVFLLPYLPGFSAEAILAEARAWQRAHAPLAQPKRPISEALPSRRLRIGYFSGHLFDHAHRFFLEPLWSEHDRESFEVFVYSDLEKPDPVTRALQSHADVWRDTFGMSDNALVTQIEADRIDVLIDLTMHMAGNRLWIYARRPAPVQICWLAYPGTTGLDAMDFRVTDPHLDPPGTDLSVYAERSLVLPETFWCFKPGQTPNVTPLPALRDGRITFGSLNNFLKVNPEVLAAWATVLLKVKGSRLVVMAPPGDVRAGALRELEKHGVEPARVSFVERSPRQTYLGFYQGIDVVLDTFPVCGHTTSMDAFWMGVPVVTLAGNTIIGRAGVSIAMNLGLPELIAKSLEEYLQIAIDLCSDLDRLSALRESLRPRMLASPLLDSVRFARDMEALYRQAWSERVASVGG